MCLLNKYGYNMIVKARNHDMVQFSFKEWCFIREKQTFCKIMYIESF